MSCMLTLKCVQERVSSSRALFLRKYRKTAPAPVPGASNGPRRPSERESFPIVSYAQVTHILARKGLLRCDISMTRRGWPRLFFGLAGILQFSHSVSIRPPQSSAILEAVDLEKMVRGRLTSFPLTVGGAAGGQAACRASLVEARPSREKLLSSKKRTGFTMIALWRFTL